MHNHVRLVSSKLTGIKELSAKHISALVNLVRVGT